jgi:hypothetical protein
MVATKQFIEDAIEGGWGDAHDKFILHEVNKEVEFCTYFKDGEVDYHGEPTEVGRHKSSTRISLGIILLDNKAWQAVGKTRGWRVVGNTEKDNDHNPQSYYEMKDFVGRLHDNLSIEEALGKLV